MADNGIRDSGFAALIGKDRTLVNRLRRGEVRPTLDVAASIEEQTEGAVPMQAWVQQSGTLSDEDGLSNMASSEPNDAALSSGTRDDVSRAGPGDGVQAVRGAAA